MGDETLRPDATAVDEGSGGTLADILEIARRDLGMTLGDLTVLSGWNDPYRVATPGRMRDAEWFAEHWTGSDARHLRGFHYTLIGNATKPDGAPYTGANKDWRWLKSASAAARWLELVPFDALDDRRASDPAIYRAERTETALSAGVGATFDAEPPLIEVAEGDTGEINIYPALSGMEAEQPYILAIFGEKSSLASEALPVAREFAADVYLETGEQSITHAYHLAERAAADGRPLALFCITDCDPSGHQMTISIARKMQALRDLQFPKLDVDVIHVGLTPDQVREFGLPSSPLSDNEKRAGRWTELMGVEQTEVDSLLALHPGALAQMLRDAIEPYFDPTLDERVSLVGRAWRRVASAAINEAIGGDPDLAARLAEIEARAEDIRQKIETLDAETSRVAVETERINAEGDDIRSEAAVVNVDLAALAGAIDLDPPDLPEADLPDRPTNGPNLVLSSAWDWVEATRRMKARKAYENGDDSLDDEVSSVREASRAIDHQALSTAWRVPGGHARQTRARSHP